MKATWLLLLTGCLVGFAGCGDSPVGTDGEEGGALVKRKPPPVTEEPTEWPISVRFADRVTDQIRSDAELRSDRADPAYVDGDCGVWANIGNFDDARFDPDRDWKRKLARECGTERLIVFEFDPPREPERAEAGAFMSVEDICTMGVGEIRTGTPAQFNVCNTLSFDAGVVVERNSATSWTVTTDGTGANATCSGDGSSHTMPFQLTIEMQGEGCR